MAIRKIVLLCAAVLLCGIIIGAICYLCSSYQALVSWYTGLNSCFYQQQTWSADFFTPGIKSDGNMYSAIALFIAGTGLLYIIKALRKEPTDKAPPILIEFEVIDVLLIGAALTIAVVLWYNGNHAARPAHDEVFSAFNAAGIHPFQTISYYMLPNNHMFYNFLNGVLFHFSEDKVRTGRFLSLLAYCGIIIAVFYWLKKVTGSAWLAFPACIAIALQCPVWGFSFQARGYELYLLAEWGMFLSLFRYIQSTGVRWLRVNVLCCCVGYFCMPSFLYMHFAQLVFMLLYMLFHKTKNSTFWKYQALALATTFLLYLPALCFSGLAAIASNSYVAPMNGFKHKELRDYLEWMWPNFQTYVEHIFSDIHFGSHSVNFILYLLPLLLLFRRKSKTSVLFGMFYLTMWAVCLAMIIGMKRMPFERNLIGHYSLTLAGIVLVAVWLTGIASKTKRIQIAGGIMLSALMISLCLHFMSTNSTFIKTTLYEYDINNTYDNITKGLDYIPPGSTVAISDAGFFYGYYYMQNGCKITKCATGNEAYFIKQDSENLPEAINGKYELVKTLGDHLIYKRK